MAIRTEKAQTHQNLGLVDRFSRMVIGAIMLGGGAVYIYYAGPLFNYSAMEIGTLVLMLASVYPLMTSMMGQDPFYNLADIRSCNDTGRNQCGTFPYQVKAALGKAPGYCDTDDERSLEACHDEPKQKPRHETWQVDKDPIMYPDDKTMDKFAEHERKKKAS